MDGNIAEFFSLLPKPTQSPDSPSVVRSIYGEDHDNITINSSNIVCLTALSRSMRKMKEYILVSASELLQRWRADTSNGLLERHLQIFSSGELLPELS